MTKGNKGSELVWLSLCCFMFGGLRDCGDMGKNLFKDLWT